MKLYRGQRDAKPELTTGTWLTTGSDAAEWYGTMHVYDVDGEILDLRPAGVDGERDDVADMLAEAGVEFDLSATRWEEIYQLCERPDFLAAVKAAGYDLVACRQWHADYSDQPYDAYVIA